MTNFAWVIDQTSCIGCHACTTACKSENEVPLGVNRTWVKYVETGTYPATHRQIAVLRCNHCAEPPCVEICPTSAMVQRPDGIVDFDTSRCIGCKACIQACPYDAIYIDPQEHVAEKCNFCAHRVDRGLLPACVVVCPTESLLFGDLDDPASRVSQVVASRATTVRRPEQGTRPKAFYVGASDAVLDPLAGAHGPAYMWADRRTGGATDHSALVSGWSAAPATARRPLPVLAQTPARPSGVGAGAGGAGAIATAETGQAAPLVGSERPPAAPVVAGVEAVSGALRPAARVAYDVFHPRPWGWKVALYLWTKGIGAGAFAVAFLASALGLAATSQGERAAAALVALVFLGLTAILLVWDLKRPERFWTILIHPQPRSWLALGAFVLTGYGALLGLWWIGALVGADGGLLDATGWPILALGLLTAVYTAFLLGQCEARDLWQNPILIAVLLAQTALLGGATTAGIAAISGSSALLAVARLALLAGAISHGIALVGGEAMASHPTANARAAAGLLVHGPYQLPFWAGGVALASILPIAAALLIPTAAWPLTLVGLVAAAGLLWYEFGFIAAGQAVPIS